MEFRLEVWEGARASAEGARMMREGAEESRMRVKEPSYDMSYKFTTVQLANTHSYGCGNCSLLSACERLFTSYQCRDVNHVIEREFATRQGGSLGQALSAAVSISVPVGPISDYLTPTIGLCGLSWQYSVFTVTKLRDEPPALWVIYRHQSISQSISVYRSWYS